MGTNVMFLWVRRIRSDAPKKFHARTTYLEDFHEPCDVKFSVEGKVVNVSDEVCDLFFKEMEMFFNIIQGVFITVDNALVVVVRPLICVIAM